MSTSDYVGKTCVVISTEEKGIIKDLLPRRGTNGALSIRLLVEVAPDKMYECMPHEIKIESNGVQE